MRWHQLTLGLQMSAQRLKSLPVMTLGLKMTLVVTKTSYGMTIPSVRTCHLLTRIQLKSAIGLRWKDVTLLIRFIALLTQDPSLEKCCLCRPDSPSWIDFTMIS